MGSQEKVILFAEDLVLNLLQRLSFERDFFCYRNRLVFTKDLLTIGANSFSGQTNYFLNKRHLIAGGCAFRRIESYIVASLNILLSQLNRKLRLGQRVGVVVSQFPVMRENDHNQ